MRTTPASPARPSGVVQQVWRVVLPSPPPSRWSRLRLDRPHDSLDGSNGIERGRPGGASPTRPRSRQDREARSRRGRSRRSSSRRPCPQESRRRPTRSPGPHVREGTDAQAVHDGHDPGRPVQGHEQDVGPDEDRQVVHEHARSSSSTRTPGQRARLLRRSGQAERQVVRRRLGLPERAPIPNTQCPPSFAAVAAKIRVVSRSRVWTVTTAARRSSPGRYVTPAWRSSTPGSIRRPSRSWRRRSRRTPTPSGSRSSPART